MPNMDDSDRNQEPNAHAEPETSVGRTDEARSSSGCDETSQRRPEAQEASPPGHRPDAAEDDARPSQSYRSAVAGAAPGANGVAASPPKFVALEEIMRAANGVSNMYLSHQIALDENFRLERPPVQEGSLKQQVESALRQAFWDILEAQLQESPPNYRQALALLQELKQDLCGLLLPQHGKLRQELDEVLDLELIRQQTENGALDFPRYAQYVLSVMGRLCAPVRDEQIRQLQQTADVVPLFKGIMQLLDQMKLDMANFTIAQLRPQLMQQSVDYERQKFQEFLDVQSRIGVDGLGNTRAWLAGVCEQFERPAAGASDAERKAFAGKVITAAYVQLLKSELLERFPETMAIDKDTLELLQRKMHAYTVVGSVLLTACATGSAVQTQGAFKQQLKQRLLPLFTGEAEPGSTEQTRLATMADFVLDELGRTLAQHQCPPLDESKRALLRRQIEQIGEPDNRVRLVIRRRLLEFIELVLSANGASPVQIPAGLSALQEELLALSGSLVKIVSFNRQVFGEHYAVIVQQLLL